MFQQLFASTPRLSLPDLCIYIYVGMYMYVHVYTYIFNCALIYIRMGRE
jgi:hypothetical protein